MTLPPVRTRSVRSARAARLSRGKRTSEGACWRMVDGAIAVNAGEMK
jgi:hypothetical protein